MKERPILFNTPMVQAILSFIKNLTRRTKGLDTINEFPNDWRFCATDSKDGEFIWQHKTDIKRVFAQKCPFGQIGDVLWVKETVRPGAWREDGRVAFDYKASPEIKNTSWVQMGEKFEDYFIKWTDQLLDKGCKSNEEGHFVWEVGESPVNWIPSLFMPKVACRLNLRITNIRIERLNDITEEDAIKEGVNKNIEPGKESEWEPDFGYEDYSAKDLDGFPCFTAKDSFQTLWESINGKDSWKENPWVWVIQFEVIK